MPSFSGIPDPRNLIKFWYADMGLNMSDSIWSLIWVTLTKISIIIPAHITMLEFLDTSNQLEVTFPTLQEVSSFQCSFGGSFKALCPL